MAMFKLRIGVAVAMTVLGLPAAQADPVGLLAALPSKPGPPIERIWAMADGTWLSLGSPDQHRPESRCPRRSARGCGDTAELRAGQRGRDLCRTHRRAPGGRRCGVTALAGNVESGWHSNGDRARWRRGDAALAQPGQFPGRRADAGAGLVAVATGYRDHAESGADADAHGLQAHRRLFDRSVLRLCLQACGFVGVREVDNHPVMHTPSCRLGWQIAAEARKPDR
jgi:hypothetical protein